MAHKRKGQLTVVTEWGKHLGKYYSRQFWKGERRAGKKLIREELYDQTTAKTMTKNKLLRMDNVLIVVEDLEAAKAFFLRLGFELEGETIVEGPSVDRLIGLQNVRATLAFMRTPDGHGRIELDKFHTPDAIRTGPEKAPVNELGIRRIMLAVEGLDNLVADLLAHGDELVGEVVQYEDIYRLAYVRGPEGIIVGLSEQLK
jgi:catechol 2,3-dioxygenase-like lactoylglutathione lyase family enzyme